MAIDLTHWRMILDSGAKGHALSAGYPDLLVRFGDLGFASSERPITVRPNSKELQNHHGWTHDIFDTHEVFAALGLELDVIDYKVIQGCERVVDLNVEQNLGFEQRYKELPAFGGYDLVIDPGTSEHCFNISQAAINLASAVKEGGHIAQAIPMSMFNHGYYNLNPKWFIDFYGQNGFEIKKLVIRHSNGVFPLIDDLGKRRMSGVPDNSVIICLAQRVKVQPFVFPIDQ